MTKKTIDDLMLDQHKYRDPNLMKKLLSEIHSICTRKWNIMEVCGGQTYSIYHYGLEELLPENIHLIHGPGCPVCVTPKHKVDLATTIAQKKDTIFCSFGDMMRVPGHHGSLLDMRSKGADVRILYSPLDTLKIAKENPKKNVVFFAIGFETTMPIYAILIKKAVEIGLQNISLLTSLYTIPTALYALSADPECSIDGFLAAGHVCAVMGANQYEELAKKLQKPVSITGFEPVDILYGIYLLIRSLEEGRCDVTNPYSRVVEHEGNLLAIKAIEEVFEIADVEWRGLGIIPNSGMQLKKDYELFDASVRFFAKESMYHEKETCISGKIMKGLQSPKDCPYFGTKCTPQHPVGAPMVSSEGVCAALLSFNKTIL